MQNAERRMQNAETRCTFFILNSAFCVLHFKGRFKLAARACSSLYSDPNAPDEQLPTLSMIIN